MGSGRTPMEKQNIRSVVGEIKKKTQDVICWEGLGAYFSGSQKREENVFYYCFLFALLPFYPFRAII